MSARRQLLQTQGKLKLTGSRSALLSFLDMDEIALSSGFSTEREAIAWLATCRFTSPFSEAWNHSHRRQYERRPMLRAFVDHVRDDPRPRANPA